MPALPPVKRVALALTMVAALPAAVVLAAPHHSWPVVRTGHPGRASSSSVRLTGAVDPRGRRTRVRFRYGRTKRHGALTTAIVLRGDDRTHRIAQLLRGLAPGTTYHVQLSARSRSGLRVGADRTFRTRRARPLTVAPSAAAPAPNLPAAVTQPPTPVLPRQAIAHGVVNPHGEATTWHFEYGDGLATPTLSAGAGTADVPVSAPLPRLAPQQAYAVHLVAGDADGAARGADVSFTTPAAANVVHATGYGRQTLYHSPQSPGATAWTGAWTMPDGSVMTAFTQATGPVDPNARSRVPESTLNSLLGYSEIASRAGLTYIDPRHDFSGLSQSVVYMRSADGGQSWQQWRVDPFHALFQQAMTPQPTIALDDGTLIRRVSGIDVATDASFPHTAVLEHLSFDPNDSSGQASDWSAPQVVLGDPSICTYQISRIRPLGDGRYVALGQAWHFLSGQSGRCEKDAFTDLLLVAGSAADVENGNWSLGMAYTSAISPSEWDVAELPGGDLLAMFRSTAKGDWTPMEAILHKTGATWSMDTPQPMPGISTASNGGHPELLAAQEGVILEFSAGAVSYTADRGASWHQLPFPQFGGSFALHPAWYPRAVQAADGTIYVFSHVGFDDDYDSTDQRIIVDRFRLAADG